jgi:type I restriction enzyme S subunit
LKTLIKQKWQTKKLGEVCDFQRGLTYSKKDEVVTSNNVVLRAGNINLDNHILNFSDLKYLRNDLIIQESKKVREGSILICTASGSKSHLGKVAYVDQKYDCAFGGFMGQLTAHGELDSRFLFYRLISNDYDTFIEKVSDGVNINNLKFDDLKVFKIPFPESLSEQQRIVSILDEAFAKIDKAKKIAEQNLKNAREIFESYLHGLEGKKESLGLFVDITTGRLDANAAKENGQYPFFTCSREVFSIDKFAFDCEAILLAGNNAVGDFNVKHYRGKFNAYQRTYVITINKESKLMYRYLYFQLLQSLKEFKLKSVGAGTKFLKIGMIKDLKITLPPVHEQEHIVTKLDALNEETKMLEENYQQKLAALEELKKSILNKAFKGEL